MTAKRTRRAFDATFKLYVMSMIQDQGRSVVQVYRDISLVQGAVCRWVAQVDEVVARWLGACRAWTAAAALQPTNSKSDGLPGLGKPLTFKQQRIRQLESENLQLKSDNDLLKKARAFFARKLK